MINKNIFLGVLTTLLVVAILVTGGLVAVSAFRTADEAGVMAGGRPGGFAPRGGDRQFQPDGPHHQAAPGRPITAAPLRGIAGVLGSLFLIGLIIAVVAGGSGLFARFRGRATPPPAPVTPADAAEETPAETPAGEKS